VRHLYSFLMRMLLPVLFVHILWRGVKNPLYRSNWAAYLGGFRTPIAQKRIWLHAASVGEFQAALPFIRDLMKAFPDYRLLISNTSPTGRARVREVMGEDVDSVLLPIDLPGAAARFCATFQPHIAVFMETEIWPNFYQRCSQNGIPILLANARLSDRSTVRYRRFAPLFLPALNKVQRICCQSDTDYQRFLGIGVEPDKLEVCGNLKFDVALDDGAQKLAGEASNNFGHERKIWLAASTREQEELIVLKALELVRQHNEDVLLVIAPRHPERFDEVSELLKEGGYKVQRRSEQLSCGKDVQVFLLDSIGELSWFYGVADVVFVGGSLVPVGGHNIIEAALWAKPIITGPYTRNLADVAKLFKEKKALREVSDSVTLSEAVVRLLNNAEEAEQMGERGKEIVAQHRGASQALLAQLSSILASN